MPRRRRFRLRLFRIWLEQRIVQGETSVRERGMRLRIHDEKVGNSVATGKIEVYLLVWDVPLPFWIK